MNPWILIFFCLFTLHNAQIDTAQIKIPHRKNTPNALQKPYLILISADGFRHDYVTQHQAQHLQSFSEQGVVAKGLVPSYPSITFPNHWSLITGLYPSHHGLIDNYFFDYQRQESYAMNNKKNAEDGSWYGGIPMWSLAEQQGVLSASLHWVGAASNASNTRPTYYYHYHEKFTPAEKIKKVVQWLKLPEEVRPHFISLYFPEVDAAGHYYGPEAMETQKAVQIVDQAIGDLVLQVKALGLDKVNFIFVSDHGMIKIDRENPLSIPTILEDKTRFDLYNAQTLLRVVVKDPKDLQPTYRSLKKQARNNDFSVYLTKRFPKKFHFSTKDDTYHRIGQILLLPKVPKVFLEKGKKTNQGKHGYLPTSTPEMDAVFFAWGDQFKKKLKIPKFPNVDVYPIMAELMGLKINTAIDGSSSTAKKILEPVQE